MPTRRERRIHMEAHPVFLDTVTRHFHEIQVCPIVIVEDQPCSNSSLSVQETQMRASFSVGDKIDPLTIAGIARTPGRVQTETHISSCIKTDSETFAARRIPDDQPRRGRHAIEVVADWCAKYDAIASGPILDDYLPGSYHIGYARGAQESGGQERDSGDSHHDGETVNPMQLTLKMGNSIVQLAVSHTLLLWKALSR